jgi:hypothetical protein
MFGKACDLGWTIGGHDISKLDLLISLPTSAQAADQKQKKRGAGGWLKRRQRFLAHVRLSDLRSPPNEEPNVFARPDGGQPVLFGQRLERPRWTVWTWWV